MSDFKSKLPSLDEFTSMAGKLFKDVKQSVGEIVDDYKDKRDTPESKTAEQKTDNPVSADATSTKNQKEHGAKTAQKVKAKKEAKPKED